MLTVQLSPAVFESPPLFSAHWLGRDPRDRLPRVVQCLGPSVHDDHAAAQATVLGLKSITCAKSPTLSRVSAEFDGSDLVLYARGRQFLRTGPLPIAVATVLQWRAEVLVVWVDIPLQDPRNQISMVGLHHVWTGIAPVDGGDPVVHGALLEGLGETPPHTVGATTTRRSAPARRPA